MNHVRFEFSHPVRPLLTAIALLASSLTMAAGLPSDIDEDAASNPATAGCAFGPSRAGHPTCMTKADFDVALSRQLALNRDPAQYLRNAQMRCEPHMGTDRSDCMRRMEGEGSISGSVEGGGILRTLVTLEPVPPAPSGTGS